MGLYIKGLRLPKKGRYTSFTVYSDGRVVFKFGGDHAGQATEVPPHGDLIDRDALMKGEGRYLISFGKEGIDIAEINRTPTIIPAEEET